MNTKQSYGQKPDVSTLPEQTAISAPTKPNIQAGLSIGLRSSLHSVVPGSAPQSTILLYALMAARDMYLDDMLQNMRDGQYQSAYASYHDLAQTNELIDELSMDAINQAECNYWANDTKDIPGEWSRKLETTSAENKKLYADWLKTAVGREAEEVE